MTSRKVRFSPVYQDRAGNFWFIVRLRPDHKVEFWTGVIWSLANTGVGNAEGLAGFETEDIAREEFREIAVRHDVSMASIDLMGVRFEVPGYEATLGPPFSPSELGFKQPWDHEA